MKTDLMIAALWALISIVQCHQWYWQGRRDQLKIDKEGIDRRLTPLLDQMEAAVERERHRTDPKRPDYLDRQ